MSTSTLTSESTKNTQASNAGMREVDPRTAQSWIISGNAIVYDVREPDEYAREHINGARLLPLSKFDPSKIVVTPGQRVILHCKSGRRSSDAYRMALPAITPVVELYNLTGGIEAWKKESLPVEVNVKAPGISVMRQVQLVIGVGVLGGSALAWFVHPGFIAIPAFFGAGLTFAGATGTCALASLIAMMPWNRQEKSSSCCTGGSCTA